MISAAALAALTLAGAGMALAGTETLQSTTALTAPDTAAQATVLSGFADIVESVRPAVVNIEVVGGGGGRPDAAEHEDEEFFEDFFKRYFDEDERRGGNREDEFSRESLERWFKQFRERGQGGRHDGDGPRQMLPRAAGAGFLIDDGGTIVTNNHVVADAGEIHVTLYDGRSFVAELIGRDSATDLAVIKIESDEPLPFVTFGDSDAARVGDWVITVGNPFGLENTVTTGIISARGRAIGAGRYDDFLQIDAPINRGNSGGPAFNTRGEVIGVNTAIFSPSGGSVGIGFAIPSSMVQEIVAELREDGRVERGWLGVHIQAVSEDLAEGLDLSEAKGALIAEVTPNGPAAAAGLLAGDVILAVNGQPIDDVRELTRTIARLDPGEDAKLGLWRKGEDKSLRVRLGAFPEDGQLASLEREQPAESESVMGMRLARLDDRTRETFDIDEKIDGVVITEVRPDSWAAREGLRRGDVILQASLKPVSTPAEVAAAVELARQEDRKNVLILFSRKDQERFVSLPLRDA